MPRTRSNPSTVTYALGALALVVTGGVVYKFTYASTLAAARSAREAKDAARLERAAGRSARRAEREAAKPKGLSWSRGEAPGTSAAPPEADAPAEDV